MSLSAHARIEIAIVATLLLGSCGENAPHSFTSADYDRLDVADTNARNAVARVDELESRVAELEQKLGE